MISYYEELQLNVKLKKDIELKNLNQELSSAINKSFLSDPNMKRWHEQNAIKMYVFQGLYPTSKEYKKGQNYSFRIRGLNRTFIRNLQNLIEQTDNDVFTTNEIYSRTVEYKPIKEIYTLTPVVVTINKGRQWTHFENSIEQLISSLNKNVIRKYKELKEIETLIDHNFIEDIKDESKNDIVITYKNGKIIGTKVRIKVKDDDLSQELAFIAMGAGIGEKNSLGFGYCVIGK